MNDSSVKSHNINFALSYPKNLKLSTVTDQDSLNEVCTDCLELWKAINVRSGWFVDLPQVDDEDDDDAQDDDMYNAIAPELNNYIHEQATTT